MKFTNIKARLETTHLRGTLTIAAAGGWRRSSKHRGPAAAAPPSTWRSRVAGWAPSVAYSAPVRSRVPTASRATDVSLEDALAAVEGSEPAEADERDWLAVLGYRRAMTYVLQLADDPHFEYSSALIRSLHFMVTEYSLEASPGLWRPGPIWVQNSVTGEIVYEAPESDAVPELIEALISSFAPMTMCRPMVRAAMAHLNLVMIHPFRDGNGRMARCLQPLALARDRMLVEPSGSASEEYLGGTPGLLEKQSSRRFDREHRSAAATHGPWVRVSPSRQGRCIQDSGSSS